MVLSPNHAPVAGVAGFVGTDLGRALLDRGIHVRVLASGRANFSNLLGLHVVFVIGDILDANSQRFAIKRTDTFFNIATLHSHPETRQVYRATSEGTECTLKAAWDEGIATVSCVPARWGKLFRADEKPLAEDDRAIEAGAGD